MANEYTSGALVRVSDVITQNGTAIDPDAVTCRVRKPSGTITTYTYGTDAALVKDSAGHYHLDVSVDVNAAAHGRWYYKFSSTGSGQGSGEQFFTVLSQFDSRPQ